VRIALGSAAWIVAPPTNKVLKDRYCTLKNTGCTRTRRLFLLMSVLSSQLYRGKTPSLGRKCRQRANSMWMRCKPQRLNTSTSAILEWLCEMKSCRLSGVRRVFVYPTSYWQESEVDHDVGRSFGCRASVRRCHHVRERNRLMTNWGICSLQDDRQRMKQRQRWAWWRFVM
jgi:hypothetical protein